MVTGMQGSDAGKILKRPYRMVEEAIKIIERLLGMEDEEVLRSERRKYALKGATLFLVQGLLGLANYLSIVKDHNPLNYKDLFLFLIDSGIVDERYRDVLINLVDIRNRLLFGYAEEDSSELLGFLRENFKRIEEVYHILIRTIGVS